FLRQAPRQLVNAVHVRELHLDAELHRRRDGFRGIKGADRERDSVRRLIGQRSAALAAEAALDMIGRTKPFRFTAGPGEALLPNSHQRSIEIAERLLAHATVAHGSAGQRALDTKPYGTALAPAE